MPDSASQEDLPQRLADAFSRIVRDALKPVELNELLRGNRSCLAGRCTTRPSGNTGALLVNAFVEIVGRVPDPDRVIDRALWNAAWALARNAHFPRRLELRSDVHGRPTYAFSIRDTCIVDPRRSEDFFHSVDPESYYGLRPEELAAFDHANAMLRASDAAARATAVAIPVADAELPAITLMSLDASTPGIEVWHTGGGCHALRIDCAGGGYILITEHDNAQIPPPTATEVDVGRFAANGDEVESITALPVHRLLFWIAEARRRASEPQTVRDYFILKLGADPDDETLTDLPVQSPCGQHCVKAIDATAELREHVQAALGESPIGEHLVELARRVIGVFWRG